MENNQTAVEWLEKQIVDTEMIPKWMYYYLEKAKEMEKEQMIDAFMGYETYSSENLELAEQYYNETYKQQDNEK